MHRPQLITWTTHTAETTTLLDYKKLYNTLHLYVQHCNRIYLYSIVYIYLINSRLDVTNSVHHHFRTATLSWCQTSGKSREEFTVIELTQQQQQQQCW